MSDHFSAKRMSDCKESMLVVGGQGFIGSYLAREALDRGMDVTTLSLTERGPSSEAIDLSAASRLQADITSYDSLCLALNGREYDYVINAGGYIDHRLMRDGGIAQVNQHLSGVINLSRTVRSERLKLFVQIGSSDEYGSQPAPQHEGMRESPISPYSFAKVAATHYLQMLFRTEAFPSATARIFLTYGPGQDQKRFLPQIIRGCIEDLDFPTSAGGQLRDFCYITDVVEGIFRMLKSEAVLGRVLNIASGEPVSIRTMIQAVRDLIGTGRPAFGKHPYRPGENMELFANIESAKQVLNWSPSTTLDEGLKRTIEHYRTVFA